jgi:hypothetical protein
MAMASGLINLSKLARLSGRPGDLDRLGVVFTRALQGDEDVLRVKYHAGNVVVDQISRSETVAFAKNFEFLAEGLQHRRLKGRGRNPQDRAGPLRQRD